MAVFIQVLCISVFKFINLVITIVHNIIISISIQFIIIFLFNSLIHILPHIVFLVVLLVILIFIEDLISTKIFMSITLNVSKLILAHVLITVLVNWFILMRRQDWLDLSLSDLNNLILIAESCWLICFVFLADSLRWEKLTISVLSQDVSHCNIIIMQCYWWRIWLSIKMSWWLILELLDLVVVILDFFFRVVRVMDFIQQLSVGIFYRLSLHQHFGCLNIDVLRLTTNRLHSLSVFNVLPIHKVTISLIRHSVVLTKSI